MPEIKTEFLFTIALDVQVLNLGDTPYGVRRVAHFSAGRFEGPKLKGTVLPGGGGWSLMRRDDVLEIGGHRLILETNDKQLIYMSWKGLRHGPKEVMDRLNRGEDVDPNNYYFRTTPYFETGSEQYAWLNRICSIATGRDGRKLFANSALLALDGQLLAVARATWLLVDRQTQLGNSAAPR
jgi:hypothetical protein